MHAAAKLPAPLPSISQPGWRDWLLLGSGITYKFTLVGFYLVAIMAILKANGYNLNQLGWVYLLGSVEIAKALLSTLMERYRIGHLGRFRGWLLLATAGILATLAALFFITPQQQFAALLASCLILSCMSALYGCAMLGLSCVLLPYRERGYGGVIQTVAARGGKMIGGALVLWVYQHQGWHAAIGLMLLFTALMLLQLLLYRETNSAAAASSGSLGFLFARLFGYWRQPHSGLRWFLLLLFIGTPYAWVAATFVPRLSDLGFSAAEIGTVLAVIIPVVCVLITPLSGYLTRHHARLSLIRLLLTLQLPLLLSFIWLDNLFALHPWLAPAQMVLLSVAYTLLLPVLLTLIMDKSQRQTAALDSSLQFSVVLLGTYAAGFAALRASALWGYRYGYIPAVILAVLVWLGVMLAGKRQ